MKSITLQAAIIKQHQRSVWVDPHPLNGVFPRSTTASVTHRGNVLFPLSEDLLEGLGLDAAACFDVDVEVFIEVDGEAFRLTLIGCLGGDPLIASGVRNSDPQLPDRVLETSPFVEDDSTITPKVDSLFSILCHPLSPVEPSLIRVFRE